MQVCIYLKIVSAAQHVAFLPEHVHTSLMGLLDVYPLTMQVAIVALPVGDAPYIVERYPLQTPWAVFDLLS